MSETTCMCGTGTVAAKVSEGTCTCGCCGPTTRPSEAEVKDLLAMREAIDRRLAELQNA